MKEKNEKKSLIIGVVVAIAMLAIIVTGVYMLTGNSTTESTAAVDDTPAQGAEVVSNTNNIQQTSEANTQNAVSQNGASNAQNATTQQNSASSTSQSSSCGGAGCGSTTSSSSSCGGSGCGSSGTSSSGCGCGK